MEIYLLVVCPTSGESEPAQGVVSCLLQFALPELVPACSIAQVNNHPGVFPFIIKVSVNAYPFGGCQMGVDVIPFNMNIVSPGAACSFSCE
jgi:hypothetical protein